jgi:hypothetical protein
MLRLTLVQFDSTKDEQGYARESNRMELLDVTVSGEEQADSLLSILAVMLGKKV